MNIGRHEHKQAAFCSGLLGACVSRQRVAFCLPQDDLGGGARGVALPELLAPAESLPQPSTAQKAVSLMCPRRTVYAPRASATPSVATLPLTKCLADLVHMSAV